MSPLPSGQGSASGRSRGKWKCALPRTFHMLVMASDGTLSRHSPLVRLDVSVIVEEKVGASGVMRWRWAHGFVWWPSDWGHQPRSAHGLVLTPLMPGRANARLGPGWPGSAARSGGHDLKETLTVKAVQLSLPSGEQVPTLCSVGLRHDVQRRGSLSVDDEGTPTENHAH